MAFENKYANWVNPLSVVRDAASENLVPMSVWLQHVIRQPMPSESQTVEVKKKGRLGRLVLPENTQYVYGPYSEYLETSVLLNPIKSVVISKITKESEKFGTQSPMSEIGAEQGKALGLGMEEDIAALIAGASSSVAGTVATAQLDLQAAALNVQISTNGHAVTGSALVAVMSFKSAFEAGVVSALDPATGTLGIFANPGSSAISGLEAFNQRRAPNGFMVRQFGVDIYVSAVVDDDATNYRNVVMDPSRAIIGVWDDGVDVSTDLEIDFFRNALAACHFSDFAIYFDEALCRLELPVL